MSGAIVKDDFYGKTQHLGKMFEFFLMRKPGWPLSTER